MKISEVMKDILWNTHPEHLTSWLDTQSVCYIGRGHRLVKKSSKRITRKESKDYFDKDIKKVERIANKLLKGLSNIPQNHFDVFCSLLFDYPEGYIENSSFYSLYMSDLRDEASERIMLWSFRRAQLFRTLRYRRTIDLEIYRNNNYDYKKVKANKI